MRRVAYRSATEDLFTVLILLKIVAFISAIAVSLFLFIVPAFAEITCEDPIIIPTCETWADSAVVGGVLIGRHCTSYIGVAHCVDSAPLNSCPALEVSGRCDQTIEECVDYRNGECVQTRFTYVCENEDSDMSPATLIDTEFGPIEETIENTCGEHEENERCSLTDTIELEGAATRIINRKPIDRAWWLLERRYNCQEGTTFSDDCEDLENDPTCKLIGDECLAWDDGVCTDRDYHYSCGVVQEIGGGTCEPINVCVEGNCLEIEDEGPGDFGLASAWLNILNEMVDDMADQGGGDVQVFGGEYENCNVQPFRDCCAIEGWVNDAFVECSIRQRDLRQHRLAGFTHYLDRYCSKRVFGACVDRKYGFCVFKSKFVRVFQEQARLKQPELFPWGNSSNPRCDGFQIGQIEEMDLESFDFTEVYQDMVDDVATPTAQQIADFLASRVAAEQ